MVISTCLLVFQSAIILGVYEMVRLMPSLKKKKKPYGSLLTAGAVAFLVYTFSLNA